MNCAPLPRLAANAARHGLCIAALAAALLLSACGAEYKEYFPVYTRADGTHYVEVEGVQYSRVDNYSTYSIYSECPGTSDDEYLGYNDYIKRNTSAFFFGSDKPHSVVEMRAKGNLVGLHAVFVRDGVEFTVPTTENTSSVRAYDGRDALEGCIPENAVCDDPELIGELLGYFDGPDASYYGRKKAGRFYLALTNTDPALAGFEAICIVFYDGEMYTINNCRDADVEVPRGLLERITGGKLP